MSSSSTASREQWRSNSHSRCANSSGSSNLSTSAGSFVRGSGKKCRSDALLRVWSRVAFIKAGLAYKRATLKSKSRGTSEPPSFSEKQATKSFARRLTLYSCTSLSYLAAFAGDATCALKSAKFLWTQPGLPHGGDTTKHTVPGSLAFSVGGAVRLHKAHGAGCVYRLHGGLKFGTFTALAALIERGSRRRSKAYIFDFRESDSPAAATSSLI